MDEEKKRSRGQYADRSTFLGPASKGVGPGEQDKQIVCLLLVSD